MGHRLGIRSDRIDVIPRGRDADAPGRGPSPSAGRGSGARSGCADDQVLVVAAARHEFQKGLDVLVDAWPAVRRELPDAALVIGGRRGNETPRLERPSPRRATPPTSRLLGPA